MKKIFIIIVVILCSLSLDVKAAYNELTRNEYDYGVPKSIEVTDANKAAIMATPLVDPSLKVYDMADVLTDTQEKEVYKKIENAFSKKILGKNYWYFDFVLVFTNSYKQSDINQFAANFYDYNDFGVGEKRDGVIIVVDVRGRDTMHGIGTITDTFTSEHINQILDHVEHSCFIGVKNPDFYTAGMKFVYATTYVINQEPKSNLMKRYHLYNIPVLSIVAFSLAISAILMFFLIKNSKFRYRKKYLRDDLLRDKSRIDIVKNELLSTTQDDDNKAI